MDEGGGVRLPIVLIPVDFGVRRGYVLFCRHLRVLDMCRRILNRRIRPLILIRHAQPSVRTECKQDGIRGSELVRVVRTEVRWVRVFVFCRP